MYGTEREQADRWHMHLDKVHLTTTAFPRLAIRSSNYDNSIYRLTKFEALEIPVSQWQ